MTEKGRFAPSPSGRMHLGNLYAFLLAWLDARAVGGRVVLRMEDLDPQRTGEPYASQLCEDLRWLGLDWDEGYGRGGPDGPYRQRERTALYASAFRALEERGLVYPCWCSRQARLAANAPHPGEARDKGTCPCFHLTQAERAARTLVRAPAWKAHVPRETAAFTDLGEGPQSFALNGDCGDFILRRADGVYAYQLAVAVDDALMGVTRVVRGRDLLSSTPWQLWLLDTLGYPRPRYGHVPILTAEDGRRLSKREQDLDVGVLRQSWTAEELVGKLAFLAGLLPREEPVKTTDLIPVFTWNKVPKGDIPLSENLFYRPL